LPSTIPAQSAGSLSSSYQQTKAVPFSFPQPPALFSSSVGLDMGSPFSRATSVFQALPFLRDYCGARLIITDTRFVSSAHPLGHCETSPSPQIDQSKRTHARATAKRSS
jgi:hypothetical protein